MPFGHGGAGTPVLLVENQVPSLAHRSAVFPEGVWLVRSSLSCGQEGLHGAKVNSVFLFLISFLGETWRSRFGASPVCRGPSASLVERQCIWCAALFSRGRTLFWL